MQDMVDTYCFTLSLRVTAHPSLSVLVRSSAPRYRQKIRCSFDIGIRDTSTLPLLLPFPRASHSCCHLQSVPHDSDIIDGELQLFQLFNIHLANISP